MKQSQHTGINAFLNASDVLESGNEDDIKKAKKAYWASYKKKWNKMKRLQCKSYEILFNQREAKFILSNAQKLHTSPTAYIKLMSLAKPKNINPAARGEMRERMILYQNRLLELLEKKRIPEEVGNSLLSEIVAIQEKVMTLLSP